MRMFRKLSIFFCAVFLLLSSVGVAATWIYVEPPSAIQTKATITLFAPDYPEVGESHSTLINALLNGNAQAKGLNTSNSKINQAIDARENSGWVNGGRIQEGRNTVGSMAKLFEEDMALFGTAVANLAFLVYFPDGADSTTYKIYTWSTADGALPKSIDGNVVTANDISMGNWRTGSNIFNYKYYPETAPTKTVWVHPVYETTVVKVNGVWQAQGTPLTGYAQACFYTENNNNNMHNSKLLSIYPPSFTTIKPV